MNEIAAIIVTYNRLELLKQCYAALLAQSYKAFDVVIVNNDSTDGTTEWLKKLNNVVVINQENTGSAGGFYTGMKYAYDNGYEWFWMMDDDGLPTEDGLEQLFSGAKKYNLDYANALVISIEDRFSLAFKVIKGKINIDDYKDIDIVYNVANPFNSTFINRRVPEKIGFIKKEMFIWGEEVEYFRRIIKNGFSVGTIVKSIHYHPKNRQNSISAFPFLKNPRMTIIQSDKERAYIFYRNLGYNTYTYGSKTSLCAKFLWRVLYFITRLKFAECKNFIIAFINGCKDKFF